MVLSILSIFSFHELWKSINLVSSSKTDFSSGWSELLYKSYNLVSNLCSRSSFARLIFSSSSFLKLPFVSFIKSSIFAVFVLIYVFKFCIFSIIFKSSNSFTKAFCTISCMLSSPVDLESFASKSCTRDAWSARAILWFHSAAPILSSTYSLTFICSFSKCANLSQQSSRKVLFWSSRKHNLSFMISTRFVSCSSDVRKNAKSAEFSITFGMGTGENPRLTLPEDWLRLSLLFKTCGK